MDRQIVYPGQIPLETDLLNTNRNTMIALGKLAGAIFGTSNNVVNGLSVVPTTPASLSVNVNAGEFYSLQNVDNAAYSSLPADTTDTVVKQGIQLQPVALSCPAPTTAGFSINYLIEAAYQDADTGSVVLPYYNANNPSQAYSGPNNSGTAQATSRQGKVVLQAKAGIAAATGSQTTPAVDAGYVALAVVTVANGQSTITAGNIVAASSGQVLSTPISTGRLLGAPRIFTSSTTYTPTPGTNSIIIEVQGGGGGGGAVPATSSSQYAVAGGGASGSYAKSLLTSGFSGVAITVGAGGAGGVAGLNNGSQGGTSSFGALISCPGGFGGVSQAATANGSVSFGQVTGSQVNASGGNIFNGSSNTASLGFGNSSGGFVSGSGCSSNFGGGGRGVVGSSNPGVSAVSYGAGGGGAGNNASGSAQAGGNGAPGVVIIWEYA